MKFILCTEPGEGKAKRKAMNVTGPGGEYVVGSQAPVQDPNQMQNMMAGMMNMGGMMGMFAGLYIHHQIRFIRST